MSVSSHRCLLGRLDKPCECLIPSLTSAVQWAVPAQHCPGHSVQASCTAVRRQNAQLVFFNALLGCFMLVLDSWQVK